MSLRVRRVGIIAVAFMAGASILRVSSSAAAPFSSSTGQGADAEPVATPAPNPSPEPLRGASASTPTSTGSFVTLSAGTRRHDVRRTVLGRPAAGIRLRRERPSDPSRAARRDGRRSDGRRRRGPGRHGPPRGGPHQRGDGRSAPPGDEDPAGGVEHGAPVAAHRADRRPPGPGEPGDAGDRDGHRPHPVPDRRPLHDRPRSRSVRREHAADRTARPARRWSPHTSTEG